MHREEQVWSWCQAHGHVTGSTVPHLSEPAWPQREQPLGVHATAQCLSRACICQVPGDEHTDQVSPPVCGLHPREDKVQQWEERGGLEATREVTQDPVLRGQRQGMGSAGLYGGRHGPAGPGA